MHPHPSPHALIPILEIGEQVSTKAILHSRNFGLLLKKSAITAAVDLAKTTRIKNFSSSYLWLDWPAVHLPTYHPISQSQPQVAVDKTLKATLLPSVWQDRSVNNSLRPLLTQNTTGAQTLSLSLEGLAAEPVVMRLSLQQNQQIDVSIILPQGLQLIPEASHLRALVAALATYQLHLRILRIEHQGAKKQ